MHAIMCTSSVSVDVMPKKTKSMPLGYSMYIINSGWKGGGGGGGGGRIWVEYGQIIRIGTGTEWKASNRL